MDGEPSTVAQTKRIAECNEIDAAASPLPATSPVAMADPRKLTVQPLKVYGGGGRLRRWTEASEALLARFDGAAGVQENRLC
jgi:hypothetical protein